MQELTPVGLSEDGARLVLVSPSGEEFAVPVDARFRAALRGDQARLGQVEKTMESALRPRDIQARIRAGESLDEVATAAQTSVETIMPYASPVLAERAHVAGTALKASVRRSTAAAAAPRTLGEAAETFMATHGLHDEDVEWDSWRRPDGRWALTAAYALEGRDRTAEFTHDVQGRFVVADNEDARSVTGESQVPGSAPASPREAPVSARRLSSVPAGQDELPLGDDAIAMVRDRAEQTEQDDQADQDEPTVEVLSRVEAPEAPEPLATQVTRPTELDVPLIADTADADWMTVDGAAPVEEPLDGPEDEGPADTVQSDTDPQASDAQPDTTTEPVEDPKIEAELAAGEKPRRKGRSSVPSWDEIMFGGGQND